MRRRTVRIAAAVVVVALVGGLAFALRGRPAPIVERPTEAAPPTPARLPYTPLPEGTVSPIVVGRSPARGAELAPNQPIELVFDRAMDQKAVESAFSLAPAVSGSIQWADARTLRFVPSQPLPRARLFDVTLGQAARAADGAQLAGPFQFRFSTAGFLEVGQVIPANDAAEVQPNATITVLFNRPVVPLAPAEGQADAPQPLSFTPPIAGRGEWLNTAVYVFHPSAPLPGGIRYSASVAAGLQGIDGSPLASEYRWSFSTARPQVLAVFPQDGERLVPIEQPISLQLSQPIDAAAARAAFHLRAGGADVPGTLDLVRDTLVFTPGQRLAFDSDYQVALGASLGGAAGAGMAADFTSAFHTVPLPRLLGTQPADGQANVNPGSDLALFFNTPIDAATVMANLQMTPPISPTQVYTYGAQIYPGDTSAPPGAAYGFHISFGARPSSSYRARIGPGIADPYGNRTGQALEIGFRTAPLPPGIQIVMPDYIATYDAHNPARVGISSVNIGTASLALFRLSLDALKQPYWDASRTPTDDTLIRRWQVPLNTPLDQPTLAKIDLLANGGALDPGAYLLTLDQPQGPPQQHVLVVSNLNVTLKSSPGDALVWANDLASGQPAAGLAFDFFDDTGSALGSASTDANGVARLKLARSENHWTIAIARQPFAAAASSWSRGLSPWDFGLDGSGALPTLAMHVYTDRPIYRPGQEVHFKGIVRSESDASFSLPPGGQAEVTITSPRGEQVAQQQLALSANGAFDGSLKLADGAALGQYSIGVSLGGQGGNASFQVAAYRPPEFQVGVALPAAELVRGAPIAATAVVSYFFGGPVANAPVQWNVLADSYRFQPAWGGRYQFGDSDDPWRCWECWWRPATPPQPILSGSGTTDAQGRLAIGIPADLKDAQGVPITDSVRLTIEATVTGNDNQAISGRASLVLHRGQLYIGLAPRGYVAQAGQPQTIDLVASDTAGRRVPGQAIDVELVKYTWDNRFVADAGGSGHWQWQEVRTSAGRQSVTTDAQGQASATFTPAEAGSYRVVARTTDAGGRAAQSSAFVWVAGSEYTPWRRDNTDQVSLIADKTSYTPGETAEILIPSPFTRPHWALITVERGGVLSYEVRQLNGNSALFRLPITAAHAPNVYVTVTLFSPPEAAGQPSDFKLGILPLAVAPDPQSLKVSLTPRLAQGDTSAQPGQTADFDVQVSDLGGQPVAAELSLDLVDQAVLSLQPRTPDAIREAFYYRRALAVGTASGLAVSGDRFLQQFDQELLRQQGPPLGSLPTTAAGGSAGSAGGAPLGTAIPASAPQAADSKSAAAGPEIAVRQQFADTAYWNARVQTDASGRASVQLRLPDNLTTWVLRGVAFTAETRVGEGTASLLVTKPLLVRPVTPRFLVVGDVVELAANVSNNTGAPLDAQVALATRGLSITGELTQTLSIPANGEARVRWRAEAQDVTSADLVFSARSGQYADASRPRLATGPEGTLPVYRYSAPEIVGTGGQIAGAGARTEAIGLPPNVDPRSGELTVRIDPSLAAGMRDGLRALEHFEYECTEQTVSRFLPNILTQRALQRLGIANPDLAARLPQLVSDGLAKLYAQQHGDGGWGWWPPSANAQLDESNPHISAYVVFGLLRAKESGYDVRDDVIAHGLDYLASKLLPTGRRPDQLSTADANQQAWLLYVLADAGRADGARLDDVYANRAKLSYFAQALLALALNRAGAPPDDARIKGLLADLNSAAVLSATGAHWEENQPDWLSMNTDTRTTAIVLMALARLDPSASAKQPPDTPSATSQQAAPASPLLPNVVRWLMAARRDGEWASTQESAWSLIALTDWMAQSGELRPDYDYGVWLNNAQQAGGHIGPNDAQTPVVLRTRVANLLSEGGNRLTIGRGAGGGQLYYTAHLRAFLPVEQTQALDRGVSVRRRYTLASCQDGPKCPELREARVGDVIRVELEIVAPNDLYYLQVEDPLPAGAEAVDTSLATTSLLAQPPQTTGNLPIAEAAPGQTAIVDSPWPWWWRWYSHSELRDEKLALFADALPRGAYLYSYTIRAAQAGEFRVIPTTAREQYFPEVYGRADGQILRITE
ncbi:Ig-like domain-containing protein [Kouleothrix sp.]|uniref:Ig-like domain-containing protein n=1 Tax=Kouleothrix sp. TaxID=2779161 RepID=UPI00391D44B7